MTKVLCGTEGKETSTQKGTNSPDFNDVLSFNFRCLPSEMFDKLVEVKILNAKQLLRDSLIGSFKLDLGMVYDEVAHCFIYKWLLLTDPADPSGGAKVRGEGRMGREGGRGRRERGMGREGGRGGRERGMGGEGGRDEKRRGREG